MGCTSSDLHAREPTTAKPVNSGAQPGRTLLQNPTVKAVKVSGKFDAGSLRDAAMGARDLADARDATPSPASAVWGSPSVSVGERLLLSGGSSDGTSDIGFASPSSNCSSGWTEMSLREMLEELAKANAAQQDTPSVVVVDVGPFSLPSSGKIRRGGSAAAPAQSWNCCHNDSGTSEGATELRVQSTSL